jgi:ABC-type phosphate transport system substrate-binding protein
MYLGEVQLWSELDASLPAVEIVPVHRCDGSGTTFGFTSYLAEGVTNEEW